MIDLSRMTKEQVAAYAGKCEEELGTRIGGPDLVDMIVDAANNNKPFTLVRIGDGEINALKGINPAMPIWTYPGNNGCEGSAANFLKSSGVEAVKNADVVGIFRGDPWIYAVLENNDMVFDGIKVYSFANLFLVAFKKFVDEILRKKKLLLIGKPMVEWGALIKKNIPEAQLIVYKGNPLIRNVGDFMAVTDFINGNEFDVCLASLGVWAGSVVDVVKKKGKVGIDYGHAASHQLAGEYGMNLLYPDLEEYYKNSKCPICWK